MPSQFFFFPSLNCYPIDQRAGWNYSASRFFFFLFYSPLRVVGFHILEVEIKMSIIATLKHKQKILRVVVYGVRVSPVDFLSGLVAWVGNFG